MRIFITGGTGFVGAGLIPYLVEKGHEVVVLARPRERLLSFTLNAKEVIGDSAIPGPWQEEVARCDAAINMAGQSIMGRWNDEKKRGILQSRLDTTRNLVDAIPVGKPFRLVSTSAVGYYGDGGERVLDETAPPGKDYLAGVALRWEQEALKALEKEGTSVAIARFAIVLAKGGGALEQLETLTKWCMNGPIAGGRQWVSWIHRDDLVRALEHLIVNKKPLGPVNLAAPSPVRQRELARALGGILKRPAITPAPAFAIKLALGEFSDTILFGQRMDVTLLRRSGFKFRHPELRGALKDIYGKQSR